MNPRIQHTLPSGAFFPEPGTKFRAAHNRLWAEFCRGYSGETDVDLTPEYWANLYPQFGNAALVFNELDAVLEEKNLAAEVVDLLAYINETEELAETIFNSVRHRTSSTYRFTALDYFAADQAANDAFTTLRELLLFLDNAPYAIIQNLDGDLGVHTDTITDIRYHAIMHAIGVFLQRNREIDQTV